MTSVIGFGRAAPFIIGAKGKVTSVEETFANTTIPIAWSGVGHGHLYQHILKNNIDYYYIDTGYFGNHKTKLYKRITKNGLNNSSNIITRPTDRLEKINLDREQYRRGKGILVIPPDQKVLNCWHPGATTMDWITQTVDSIKQNTDRPITVRERIVSRTERVNYNKFTDALQQDVYATVVWSSNCAVESILHGIPVVNAGPTATHAVSPNFINSIDQISDLDKDLVELWLRHLSYSQFTDEEMVSGLAWEIINQ